ncbi:MAG: hypothetical protein M0R66_05455, partial [Candidatus Omnitrophica bacterium]|nr:hypothetical protein [Candidatus Omnitrophota bacterium]
MPSAIVTSIYARPFTVKCDPRCGAQSNNRHRIIGANVLRIPHIFPTHTYFFPTIPRAHKKTIAQHHPRPRALT